MNNNKSAQLSSSGVEQQKSDEVQIIIDRMPINGAYKTALITFVLVVLIIILGFIIKYPETVDGRVSVTAQAAPIRLVASSSGKIILLIKDKQTIENKQTIAYIDNGANYDDIIRLRQFIDSYSIKQFKIKLSEPFKIGEITSQYSRFELLYKQYQRFKHKNIYQPIQQSIQEQIRFDRITLDNLDNEIAFRSKAMKISLMQHSKDSILFNAKSISEVDFNRRASSILEVKAGYQSLNATRSNILSKIASLQIELSKSKLEESEKEFEIESSLLAAFNDLCAAIKFWEQKYEIISPIDGIVEFSDFWKDNSFIQSGMELFSIIPIQKNLFGEIKIPSYGAGKVKVGQNVNVKLDDYPFDEYGSITGVVSSISKISNTIKTQQGEMESYRVLISFPKGLTSSFGVNLETNFETKGTAEIITSPKRLINRLFDNLKASTVK